MSAQINDALLESILGALRWREGFCTANKSRPNSGKFERCRRAKDGNTRELLRQLLSQVLFSNGADAVCALANILRQTQCAAGHTDAGGIGWFCGQAMPLWLQMRTCFEQATLPLSDPLQYASVSALQNITDDALRQTTTQMQTFCNMIATLGSSWDPILPTSISGPEIPVLPSLVTAGPSTTNSSPPITNNLSTTSNSSITSNSSTTSALDDAASDGISAQDVPEDASLFVSSHSTSNLEDPQIDWSNFDMTTLDMTTGNGDMTWMNWTDYSTDHSTTPEVLRSVEGGESGRNLEDFQFKWSNSDMTTIDGDMNWNGFSPYSTPLEEFGFGGESHGPATNVSPLLNAPVSSPPSFPLATTSSSDNAVGVFSHALEATSSTATVSHVPAQGASPGWRTPITPSSSLAPNGNGRIPLTTPPPPPVKTTPPPPPGKMRDGRPRLNRVGHAWSTDKRRRMVEEDEAGEVDETESAGVCKKQKVVAGDMQKVGAGLLGFLE